jgi:quinolinate synthase
MQLNNLEKLYLVMKYGNNSQFGGELQIDEALRIKAKISLQKMLEMS